MVRACRFAGWIAGLKVRRLAGCPPRRQANTPEEAWPRRSARQQEISFDDSPQLLPPIPAISLHASIMAALGRAYPYYINLTCEPSLWLTFRRLKKLSELTCTARFRFCSKSKRACVVRPSSPTILPRPAPRTAFLEGWPSGLRRTLGKRVYGKPYRGFESHSLRSPSRNYPLICNS
jgi:hypothetical protein